MLTKIMEVIANAYDPDGIIMNYYVNPAGDHGDGLAKFIVDEVRDTNEPDKSTQAQAKEALRLMQSAAMQLEGVIAALEGMIG